MQCISKMSGTQKIIFFFLLFLQSVKMSEWIFNKFQEYVWDFKCRLCGIDRIHLGVLWGQLKEIAIMPRVAEM